MVLLMQLQLKTSLNVCVILVLVLAVMQLPWGNGWGNRFFLFLFFFNLATKVRTFERRNVFVRKFPLAAAALRKGPLQKATKTRNKKCN